MIRPARPDDLPAVLDLVRELARFEREPDVVETTEEQLRQALFGPAPQVFAHVAEDATGVVAVAIWFVNYSTWTGAHGIHLEDLVVTERARSAGLGRALLQELARVCVERGYRRLDWAVLDWNVEAQGFYRSLGAAPMPEWTGWRLTGDALAGLAQPAGQPTT